MNAMDGCVGVSIQRNGNNNVKGEFWKWSRNELLAAACSVFQFSSVQHVWRVTCWERKEMICGPIWAPNSIRGKWITTTPPTILFLRMTNPSLHWKLMKRSTKPRTAQTGRVTGYVPVYTNIFFSSLAQWFKALIGSNIGLIFGSTSSTGRTDPILTILWKIIQNYVGLWEKKTLQTSSERISSLNFDPCILQYPYKLNYTHETMNKFFYFD
jgi:hypothetical protein